MNEAVTTVIALIKMIDELGSKGGYVGGVVALLAIIIFNEYRRRTQINGRVDEREKVSHDELIATVNILSDQYASSITKLDKSEKDLEVIKAKVDSYYKELVETRTQLTAMEGHVRSVVAYANRLRYQVDRQAKLIRDRLTPLDQEASDVLYHKDGSAFWPEGLPEYFKQEK